MYYFPRCGHDLTADVRAHARERVRARREAVSVAKLVAETAANAIEDTRWVLQWTGTNLGGS